MKKIMKISSLLSVVLPVALPLAMMAVALSSCKTVDTPDGKIPAEYVDAAKKYEGTYHGQFQGMEGDLTLKIDGDTPVLTYSGANGNDIMGKGCGSSIGLMRNVTVSDGNPISIENAEFEFNPGYCAEGRTLLVGVETNDKGTTINLSAVKGHYDVYVPGQMICHQDGHGHTFCEQTPGHYETRFRYVNGSFSKAN